MLRSVALVVVLVTAGCSKKRDDHAAAPAADPKTAPADPKTVDPKAADPKAADPKATGSGGVTAVPGPLDCNTILGPELREKHFKGFNIADGGTFGPQTKTLSTRVCTIKSPKAGEMSFDIIASCGKSVTMAKQGKLSSTPKAFPELKPIDGVADSLAQSVGSVFQFFVYDPDSDCELEGHTRAGVDGPAFVKDWLTSFPPK